MFRVCSSLRIGPIESCVFVVACVVVLGVVAVRVAAADVTLLVITMSIGMVGCLPRLIGTGESATNPL